MTKKRVFIGLIILIIGIVSYIFIQFNNAYNVEQTCLNTVFEEVLEQEDSIALNKVYNFSEIFTCEDWDELIIVGGKSANNAIIFLKEGVALPKIDYRNRLSGSVLFYFIKDGKLISPQSSFWHSDFLYFKDFNYFDYVSLNKEDVVFKCVDFEVVGFEDKILTFELVKQ